MTGPRSGGDKHNSDRNTRFKNGTYCGMLCGDVVRYYPKQVVSLIKAGNAPANMRKFLPWTQKHFHVDATDEPSFVVACSSGRKAAPGKDRKKRLVRTLCKIRGMILKQRCASRLDPDPCPSRHTKETYGTDRRNFSAFCSSRTQHRPQRNTFGINRPESRTEGHDDHGETIRSRVGKDVGTGFAFNRRLL